MKPPEKSGSKEMVISVAGHEFRLQVDPAERHHVERAATQTTERFRQMLDRAGSASTAQKVALMVAFQFACDLSIANECLDEAEELHAELKRQREAVTKLENLLAKMDNALA